MTLLDVRFSDWIQRGFALFVNHALLLFMSGLVALVITALTLGLLAGPMLAGLAMMVLTLMDGRMAAPTINDLFRGFDHVKTTIPVTVALYVIWLAVMLVVWLPGPGFVLGAVLASVGGSTAVMTVFHLVARHVTPRESAGAWWALFKANWGPLLGFYLLATLLGSIGVYALVIGLAVTFPLYMCMMGQAYAAIVKQSVEL